MYEFSARIITFILIFKTGSLQQLKEKLKAGFSLELRVDDSPAEEGDPAERASRWVQQKWPNAELVERFESRLVYRIPHDDVPSLATAFEVFQNGKLFIILIILLNSIRLSLS